MIAVVSIQNRQASIESEAAAVIARAITANSAAANSLVKKNGFVSIGYWRRNLLIPDIP